MERVAFLLEATGERIGCLLNPSGLVIRRLAGVQPRRGATGQLTGTGLPDNPLLFTGGGRTELELDLLFDVSLAGSTITTADVRDLTRPLAGLAENQAGQDRSHQPPRVRFVWGKSWNIPGIVSATSERFEQFTPEGAPQRSWLRMRLLRIGDAAEVERSARSVPVSVTVAPAAPASANPPRTFSESAIPESQVRAHEILGGGPGGERTTGERLDEIAAAEYGDPTLWRALAAFNDIDDPMHIPAGRVLRIPPLTALR
jgi:hypothetical protein